MKRSRICSQRHRPWALCALLVAGAIYRPAIADTTDLNARAAALRSEAKSFEHGSGSLRNPEKAIELYCQAARLGDLGAQYDLGWMYAMGRGIERDDAMAAYFFTMAAKQGDALSERMLRQVGSPVATPPKCLADPDVHDKDGHDIVAKATPEHRKVMDLVLKLAPEYGVYPRLAMAIIRAESNFNPGAISPKNAQGLMQLIPETANALTSKSPLTRNKIFEAGFLICDGC